MKHRIIAFTGAGISRASGIPTFEEMGDIRDKLSREYFLENPNDFYDILLKMKKLINSVKPNPAHRAIAKYKVPVITMNIDGLHSVAGSEQSIEVHGNLDYVYCEDCDKKFNFEAVEESIFCKNCNEILKPNVVLYGDNIADINKATEFCKSTEEVLVVGTSFYTSTSSVFVQLAKQYNAKITIINDNAEVKVEKYLYNVFEKKR